LYWLGQKYLHSIFCTQAIPGFEEETEKQKEPDTKWKHIVLKHTIPFGAKLLTNGYSSYSLPNLSYDQLLYNIMKVEINITESRSRDFSAVFLHCKFLEPSS
jgi:hypothetical protein